MNGAAATLDRIVRDADTIAVHGWSAAGATQPAAQLRFVADAHLGALARFLRKIPGARFEPATGEATMCALAVETDDATGLARRIGAVRLGGRLEQARPTFWE